MSGTFPSSPAPRRIEFGSIQPTRVSTAHSLKRYTRTLNAQRWMLKLDFSPFERADLADIFAFLIKQRGQYDSFTYVLPSPLYTPRGSLGGSPVVDNEVGSPTATQSGRALNIRGCSASITDWGKAGDFFKVSGHSKVYMLTADADTDGSGKTQLVFDPALVTGPADGEALTFTSVPFTVALAADQQGFELGLGSIFQLRSLDLIEAY
jgi:hypothetical protein